jgi:hypothetical protein
MKLECRYLVLIARKLNILFSVMKIYFSYFF